ncbi:prefoldin subunit alpha [Candidatus Woesearchaeota archaeon]|jgi:prefoldin alpha subunit|nr:prefoldin subunit alpha [Candidatus Woesearchaeota archaeon]MBT4835225.1 prefoldin subunit alpha [Candidatus Woesearchaeota archaeon]MBT6734900.1 prefoldin subunit alpha [Candidatus Woesearchaeota archaeon]MBT7169585.1 prefoldin subunit alpha [Candidatus Woesearchaeota archaeon]MBT7474543.1 prefoldin subunit alpha [Candidatus Woesearchaeota archaeon]
MVEDKQMDQQKMMAQQMMAQQVQQMEQQIASVGQQIFELNTLKDNLKELKEVKNTKMKTPLGAGIFIESELKDVSTVLMGVGSGVIVKKSTDSAIEVIEKQIKELDSLSKQMQNELTEFSKHLGGI